MVNIYMYSNNIPTSFVVILYLLYFLTSCESLTATLGIDWGEEFVEVSIAFRGYKPDILLNGSGSRKFHNVSYFMETTRLFDRDALPYLTKDPLKTFKRSAHLLGLQFPKYVSLWSKVSSINTKCVIDVLSKNNISYNYDYNPYEFGTSGDGQLFLNIVKSGYISVEEANSHFFHYIKALAVDKLLKSKIIDSDDEDVDISAIIAIPCDYNQDKRRSIKFSAECAGIKVLDLIHGISAAAWFGSFEMEPGIKKVLFYDLGSSGANVGVVEFNIPDVKSKNKIPLVKTLSCVTVRDIGGFKYDTLLADHLRGIFETKNDIKLIPDHPRALQKLLSVANNIKSKLSYSEYATVDIENLIKNIRYERETITRNDFEKLLNPVLDKLHIPVVDALELSGVKKDELTSVELIGGAWRVPLIHKKLSEIMSPLQLGFHLNAEESIAMGSGYLSAKFSPFFKMRKIDLSDNSSFKYSLNIRTFETNGANSFDKNIVLYDRSSKINTIKSLDFYTSLDFHLVIYENDVALSNHTVNGISDLLKKEGNDKIAHVQLVFNSRDCGVIKFESAYANVIDKVVENVHGTDHVGEGDSKGAETVESETKQDVKDAVTSTDGTLSEGTDSNVDQNQHVDQVQTDSQESVDSQTQDSSKDVKDTTSLETEKEKPVTPKSDKETFKHKLQISSVETTYCTESNLKASKLSVDLLVKSDKNVHKRSNAKNQLESLLYKYKAVLKNEDFKVSTTPDVFNSFSKRVSELLDWFDLNSEDSTLDEFNKFIQELNDVALPIYKIMDENLNRPHLIKVTDHTFDELNTRLEVLKKDKPFIMNHSSTISLFENSFDWWKKIKREQEKRPLHVEPLYNADLVKNKLDIAKYAIATLEKLEPEVSTDDTGGQQADGSESKDTEKSTSEGDESVKESTTQEEEVRHESVGKEEVVHESEGKDDVKHESIDKDMKQTDHTDSSSKEIHAEL